MSVTVKLEDEIDLKPWRHAGASPAAGLPNVHGARVLKAMVVWLFENPRPLELNRLLSR